MKPRAWLTLLAIAAPALASLSLAGCEADLEVGCVSGDCTGASIGASSHASGVSSGGGGSDTQECLFTETGELPCPVFTILDARCHRCHQDPTKNGAPFALLTWNDFQADYGSRKRWEAAAAAVEPEAFPQMPFGEDPLPEAQLATLREWFDTCRAGDCAKEPLPTGEGGSGGSGGAGGAGAGGSGAGAGGAGGAGGGGVGAGGAG